MRRAIKSYLAFTSLAYRIWMFPVELFFFWGISIYCGRRLEGGLALGVELFLMNLLMLFEILSDHWLFGGICAKGNSRLEYLKTALGGNRMLRDGIVMDTLRRFVAIMGTVGIWALAAKDWTQLQTGLVLFLGTALGVGINRYLEGIYLLLLTAWLVSGLVGMGLFGAGRLSGWLVDCCGSGMRAVVPATLLLISGAVGFAQVCIVMNKMKGSYWDERC